MKKISFPKSSSLVIAVAALTAISGVQAAQLEEIVVTAQKRVESLQDIPISITTIDGGKIEEAGINNIEDLAAYVPNLMLTENAVATSIVMRGVGPGANQSFEQSVGLYVDGIHLAKGRQTRTGLFDLERVEVLRGPQGILFGKNTLAGAINVSSATPLPGDEFSGKISVGIESNDGQEIQAHLAGSITDKLAVRFAFKDREDDGYLPNSLINRDGPSTEETLWRLAATWQPTDNVTVKFKHAEGDNKRVGATSVVNILDPVNNLSPANRLAYGIVGAVYPQVAINVAGGILDQFGDGISLGGNALAASLGGSTVAGEKPVGTDTQNSDTSLNIDVDFGDGYTFTSVTGYSEYEYEDGIDADFLPIQFIGRSDISDYEQTSQEFRIASDPSKRFSYIAGAYIEEQTQNIDRNVSFDGTLGVPNVVAAITGWPTLLVLPPAAAGFFGVPFGVNGLTSFNQMSRTGNWIQETDSWAVFFQGEYQISDSLTLTAGVRYTEEDKDARGRALIGTDTTGLANHNPNPFLAAIFRGIQANTFDHDYIDSRTTDQTTPGVSLEWSRSDDHLYYASYQEGFKSGGFNAVDDQAPDLSRDSGPLYTIPGAGWSYDDETASSFEIGGKHTLLDGAMNFNWSLFSSDYDDQQISTFVGTGFVVRNAASSSVDGLELDVRWQATDNLFIGTNLALLDAAYGAFPTAGCTEIQSSNVRDGLPSGGCTVNIGADGQRISNQDLAGKTLPHAPEYSGALFAEYGRSINDNMAWFFNVDVNFTDEYLLTGDLDPLDRQEGFEKINVRTGIRGDSWELMFYGKNITDEETASGGFDVPLLAGTHAIYTDPGDVFGARFSYGF